MTQATEAQQKQNNFRSCPVFSAASLQWRRSLYRNSLLYSAAEFFMLRRNHPSRSTKRTEISFPVPSQLSLLLWWSGIRGVSWQCSITPKKLCFPGQKSIHQDCRHFCRENLPSLQHWYEQDMFWERTGGFSVFLVKLVFQCFSVLHTGLKKRLRIK